MASLRTGKGALGKELTGAALRAAGRKGNIAAMKNAQEKKYSASLPF